MSISDLIIKVLGIILIVVGVALILSAVGIVTFASLQPWWFAILMGLLLAAIGFWVLKGGSITL